VQPTGLALPISFLTQLTVLRRAGVFETLEGDHENPRPHDWNGLAVLGRLPPSLAQFSGETEAAPNLIPLSLYNAIVEAAYEIVEIRAKPFASGLSLDER
jgi:hypothetical protein